MRNVDRDSNICYVNCLYNRRYKVASTAAPKPKRKRNKTISINSVEWQDV